MNSWPRRIGAALLALIVLFFFGLRIDHPASGLSNSLGSAKSSIAIYISTHDVAKDAKVIYASSDPKLTPGLGSIYLVHKDSYDVGNGKFLEGVTKKNIRGKLLIVIPFLGWPLSLIGL